MNGQEQIPDPFPKDIDRDYFGGWLSGFTDGEGCFFLGISSKGTKAEKVNHSLSINLRNDDVNCLYLIQSYLECGHINGVVYRRERQNAGAVFRVSNIKQLIYKVIPHFNKFPLIAKKRRDYLIWKEGVALVYRIKFRSRKYFKWTEEERDEYESIISRLREQRKYKESE